MFPLFRTPFRSLCTCLCFAMICLIKYDVDQLYEQQAKARDLRLFGNSSQTAGEVLLFIFVKQMNGYRRKKTGLQTTLHIYTHAYMHTNVRTSLHTYVLTFKECTFTHRYIDEKHILLHTYIQSYIQTSTHSGRHTDNETRT